MTLSNPPLPPLRTGIVGAGQLAMMLAAAGSRLGLEPMIFATSKDEPAARAGGHSLAFGSQGDAAALALFLAGLDVVCIEQELDTSSRLLEALASVAADGRAPTLVPSPAALALCSDKLMQKQRLHAAGIPTPPWLSWSPKAEAARTWIERVAGQFPDGAVLKLARGGYDGRGNLIVRNWEHADIIAMAEQFCAQAPNTEHPVYAERLVPFVAELAVVTTRWQDGRMAQYPAALTMQKNGVCAEVRGPATAFGLSLAVTTAAQTIAAQIGGAFDLVGTYAVELFLSKDACLEVNEIAPRVHNSAHYTLTAAATSQFENHWRAAIGLDPGSVDTVAFWGMVNIIGVVDADLESAPPPALHGEGIIMAWYFKKTSRPGRKLGHVNVTASSVAALDTSMSIVSRAIEEWGENLRKRVEHVAGR